MPRATPRTRKTTDDFVDPKRNQTRIRYEQSRDRRTIDFAAVGARLRAAGRL